MKPAPASPAQVRSGTRRYLVAGGASAPFAPDGAAAGAGSPQLHRCTSCSLHSYSAPGPHSAAGAALLRCCARGVMYSQVPPPLAAQPRPRRPYLYAALPRERSTTPVRAPTVLACQRRPQTPPPHQRKSPRRTPYIPPPLAVLLHKAHLVLAGPAPGPQLPPPSPPLSTPAIPDHTPPGRPRCVPSSSAVQTVPFRRLPCTRSSRRHLSAPPLGRPRCSGTASACHLSSPASSLPSQAASCSALLTANGRPISC